MNLNCANVLAFDPTLYSQLVRYPTEVMELFDEVTTEAYQEAHGEEPEKPIQIRPFGLNQISSMRDLDPSDIDRLVCIRGMITRSTAVIPDMKTAYYKCSVCSHGTEAEVRDGRVKEPAHCPNCSKAHTMAIYHNRSTFSDKQLVKLQETPDEIPDGETPHTINLCVFDDLVDVGKPGDRVEVTGIFRAMAIRKNQHFRNLGSVFKTYIDVVHFKKADDHRLSTEDAMADQDSEFFTSFNEGDDVEQAREAHKQKMISISQRPDIYDVLTRSIAPSIFESEDVKKGMLCQLFGGCCKTFKESAARFRGDINILLVGDPATSKSQMLKFVHKIAPRGIYTSGKGSSAVGLTAYITKDPETRESVLESGALVLSDRGICCIDEFDKMNDATRAVLHEVMEQQTVSVAKSCIICSLNARTSVLAAANPIRSKYDPTVSVVENIDLPPSLMSRFDLIYLVLDKADPISDRRLAKHLIAMYGKNGTVGRVTSDEYLPSKDLNEYISFAKQHIRPHISDEAASALVQGYAKMRSTSGNRKVITATPRQLDGLIRLSESLAKMRLSEFVECQDVAEAIRLMKCATQSAATDPRTGCIDMDAIMTGRTAAMREESEQIASAVLDVVSELGNNLKYGEIFGKLQAGSSFPITKKQYEDALHVLENEGRIQVSIYAEKGSIRVLQT
eukprot:TRINITY_DN38123_c0_g1_i2.p1 TRINITY_DN38123_c0_g1~~TRINITY_DN38123_c0_g1_i2.p1  ORF type:complete len:676 (+),score=134.55 TRINITY_DN38123_c0_g1_i2:431-2458(+)